MNKQPDKKELDKKAGNEPESKGWEEIPAEAGGGEEMAEYDLPEVTVSARREIAGGIPAEQKPKPVLGTMFARKGEDEARAARERGMKKNRNMTDFINLLGWLSAGDPQKPLPVPLRRNVPVVPGKEDPEPSGKKQDGELSGRKREERVEKEAGFGSAFAANKGQERQGADGHSVPRRVRLDELYTDISSGGYQKDFGSFARDLDTPAKRRAFYNALEGEGRDVGSYADFEADVSKDLEKIQGEKEVRSYRDGQIKNLYAMTGGRPQDFPGFRKRMDDPENWEGFYNEAVARGLDLGEYDDFVANLSGLNKKQEKPEDFWDGYIGDTLERSGARALDLGAAIVSAGDIVDRVAIRPFLDEETPATERPLRKRADKLYRLSDELRQKSDRYNGETLVDQWTKGKYADFLGNLGLGLGEALPDAALVAAIKGAAAPVIIGASAVKKYDDLNRMPETKDMPEWQKAVNAIATGGVEALVEKLGGKVAGKQVRELYKNVEKSVVKRDVSKQVTNWLEDVYRKLGILPESIGKGVEEMAARIGENIADYATGVTEEWNPMKGVEDRFVNGVAEGLIYPRRPGTPGANVDKSANRKTKEGVKSSDVPKTDANPSDRIREKMEEINRGEMDGEITVKEPGRMLYDDKAVTVALDRSRRDGKVEIRDENGNLSLVDVKDLKPSHVVENMPDRSPRKAGGVADDVIEYQGRKINRDDAADFVEKLQAEIDRLSRGLPKDAQTRKLMTPKIRELKQIRQEVGGLLKPSGVRMESVENQ